MNTVINDNISATNSVTSTLKNSRCIICGTAFQTARASKLYCSNKCKQFGYTHKEKIKSLFPNSFDGINEKTESFYIDEFSLYDKRFKLLKRYRELKRKDDQRENAEVEIKMRQQVGLEISKYLWDTYTTKQLTQKEEDEIEQDENEFDEEFLLLSLKELTLEQWSFLKSLYSDLDELSFYRTASSLSREFINELNLNPIDNEERDVVSVIKKRFINHCNLIVEGKIKFIQKPDQKDETRDN